MDANALQMMVIPILAGLGLGTALGAFALAVVKTIDGIAGLGRHRAPTAPMPRARWHPIVVGLGPRRARLPRH